MSVTKARTYLTQSYLGQEFDYYGSSTPFDPQTGATEWVNEICTSDSHSFKDGHWSGGGPLIVRYNRSKTGVVNVGPITGNAGDSRYEGGFAAAIPTGGDFPVQQTPDAFGAQAFQRAKNSIVAPSFGSLNAIYELREVPEMLRQRFTKDLIGASNFWLALQFGWRPLLNDIRNFVEVQRTSQKRLRQLIKDNGQSVRRTVRMRSQSTASSTISSDYGVMNPVLVTGAYAKVPQLRIRTTVSDDVWASGRFRYFLPEGPQDVDWTRRMTARIYGFQPTPSVVYKAIPWSWLVDWFTNLGSLIQNLDSGVADRFAAEYFYVMRRYETRRTYEVTGLMNSYAGGKVPISVTGFSEVGSKVRTPGDPFGFATNQNSLSPMQTSIIGALGLSRLR